MVGPQGCVVGVEHIPELVASSIKNVEKSAAAPLLKDGSLKLHVSGMFLGLSNVNIKNVEELEELERKMAEKLYLCSSTNRQISLQLIRSTHSVTLNTLD